MFVVIFFLLLGTLFFSCSGDDTVAKYYVKATVSGLLGSGLKVKNGDTELSITGNGELLVGEFDDETSYNLELVSNPINPYQECSITSGSGIVSGEDINDIKIECINTLSFLQDAYIKPFNSNSDDQYAAHVVINKTGDVALVASMGEDSSDPSDPDDNGAPSSGAVYVYERNASRNWVKTAYLKHPCPDTGDQFGSAIAINKDGTVVVISARYGDNDDVVSCDDATSITDAGEVYVFEKENGTWTRKALLKASNPDAQDYFGISVAIDATGTRIVVGSYKEDGNGSDQSDNSKTDSGAVYVFRNDSGTWVQEAYLKASTILNGAYFGNSVSINDDGTIIAVGAYYDSPGAVTNAGTVYIFERDGTNWGNIKYVTASNLNSDDHFGVRVSLNGKGNILAVGSYQEDGNSLGTTCTKDSADSNSNSIPDCEEDNSSANSGAVYIFTNDGTNWEETAYIKASNTGSGDYFGISLSLNNAGDRLLVGAPYEDNTNAGLACNESDTDYDGNDIVDCQENDTTDYNSGAAYIYKKDSNGSWSFYKYIKSSNSGYDLFANDVSISDYDMIIGAPFESSSVKGINNDDGEPEFDIDGLNCSGASYIFSFKGI